jgi:hypothetical protein
MKYELFLFLAFFLMGCRIDSPAPVEQTLPILGVAFDVKIGESVSIQNEQLNFRFLHVSEDSRCPEGGICVWEGNAAVIIQLLDLKDTLNTTVKPKESTCGPYLIVLLKLTPYPKVGVPKDTTQYIARFIVTKIK